MRKLVILFALLVFLCGGCAPKSLITLRIPDSDAQIMMKLIPAGTFNMGSLDLEVSREEDEGPRHSVTITEPFYIGVYEVTQEQWEAVMGDNPSYYVAPGNPVERVSWEDCKDFITELNTKGIGTFRLPTEAEWEYACRAGSSTRYCFGDDLAYAEIGDYAWYLNNSSDATHIVGKKKSNVWGLYDMHGNVWEWCNDYYGAYEDTQQTDPLGPSTGSERVLRGGCFANFPGECRSAFRLYATSTVSDTGIGFRLVRTSQ